MFKLLGNDFNPSEIKKWYDDEEEFHNQFSGGRNDADEYWPVYEVFNKKYAINKYVNFTEETKILSFGCAEGSDTAKLYREFNFKLYGLEASDELIKAFKKGFPKAEIVKADITGKINYLSDFFDYIFCFGVLHHVPNVSFILKEFHRILNKNGIAVIREPVCWMYYGDVRPQELSPNERGIPVEFFRNEFENLNFEILNIKKSYYKPLMYLLRKSDFLSKFPNIIYSIDNIMCKIPDSANYYPNGIIDKFAASSAYYIVRKK